MRALNLVVIYCLHFLNAKRMLVSGLGGAFLGEIGALFDPKMGGF